MTGERPKPVVSPDLEYDLAHDAPVSGAAEAGRAETGRDGAGRDGAGRAAGDHQAVATGTPDYDGDYSYDLAHDIPRS